MFRTFKRPKSPNKQVSSQSLNKKLLAGSATLLIVLSGGSSIASAATPSTTGVRLKPQAPLLTSQNADDGGCNTHYQLINSGRYNDPNANFAITGVQTDAHGNYEYVNLPTDWLMYDQGVGYKSKLVLTETATNPGDYFVDKDGNHVSSISYTRGGPATVTSPKYCLDQAPVAGNYYEERTTLNLTPVVYDVIANASDPDNAATSLKLSNVKLWSGEATVSVVTLANGHQAVKLTPTPGYPVSYYNYMHATYTLTDPLGKSGGGSVDLRYKL